MSSMLKLKRKVDKGASIRIKLEKKRFKERLTTSSCLVARHRDIELNASLSKK